MKIIKFIIFQSLILWGAACHGAVINFDNQEVGAKFDPYYIDGVQFTDTVTSYVFITNTVENGGNNALAAPTDDDSALVMLFQSEFNFLSFNFGNDDPNTVKAGDLAVLDLYLQGQFAGQVTAVLNGNDLVDQLITTRGVTFDAAFFYFSDSKFNPLQLSELIDNVTFDKQPAAVPEPGCLMVFGMAAAALVGTRRYRRGKTAV